MAGGRCTEERGLEKMSGHGGPGHKRLCERRGKMGVILNWGLTASALWFLKTAVSILWKEDCRKVGDPLQGTSCNCLGDR